MAGNVPPVADEREGLLQYLSQQRYVLKLTAYGLTDEQARSAPSVSALTVGGLIKDVAATEQSWIDIVLQQPGSSEDEQDEQDEYVRGFHVGEDESLASIIAAYDEVAARTEAVIAEISDLSQPVPVPKGVPWFPDDLDAWSVRWVLLHIIEETARHAGHADIVRESVDGATAFPLMAAAEGWPSTPWLQPWQPPSGAGTKA
jgi:hypothetical protein